MKNKKNPEEYGDVVKCECGYYNLLPNVKTWGTCTRCGKVIDKKAKFKFEMYTRLRLWRSKK